MAQNIAPILFQKGEVYMSYSLVKLDENGNRTNVGDSGKLFEMYKLDINSEQVIKHDDPIKPEIGYAVRVGSLFARSYSNQDYWTTTPVTQILEEKTFEDGAIEMKFKTRNSVYLWMNSGHKFVGGTNQ